MTQLLVFTKNRAHVDARIERQGCAHAGMIFCVVNNKFTFGKMENKQVWLKSGGKSKDWNGNFYVIKTKDRLEKCKRYCEPQEKCDDGSVCVDNIFLEEPKVVKYRLHEFYVEFSLFDKTQMEQLERYGTLTVESIKPYIKKSKEKY